MIGFLFNQGVQTVLRLQCNPQIVAPQGHVADRKVLGAGQHAVEEIGLVRPMECAWSEVDNADPRSASIVGRDGYR
jgi:hypothetical protein